MKINIDLFDLFIMSIAFLLSGKAEYWQNNTMYGTLMDNLTIYRSAAWQVQTLQVPIKYIPT